MLVDRMIGQQICLASALTIAASLVSAAAQPTVPPPQTAMTTEDLAKACEAKVRERATVVAITSQSEGSSSKLFQRYQITFQGQPGSTVEATCMRSVKLGTIVLIVKDTQQIDRPTWGADGRPQNPPLGDSPCDSADEVRAFQTTAVGSDTDRLIPGRASRQNNTLILKVLGSEDPNRQVQFKDETDGSRYRFLAWLPQHNAYVVYTIGDESSHTIVVNASTGKQIVLPGYPVWSPSGRWVAADSMTGPIDDISLGIWDWQAMTPREEFRANWGDGAFCVQGWNGNDALRLQALRRGKPGEIYDRTPSNVNLVGNEWRLSKLSAPR